MSRTMDGCFNRSFLDETTRRISLKWFWVRKISCRWMENRNWIGQFDINETFQIFAIIFFFNFFVPGLPRSRLEARWILLFTLLKLINWCHLQCCLNGPKMLSQNSSSVFKKLWIEWKIWLLLHKMKIKLMKLKNEKRPDVIFFHIDDGNDFGWDWVGGSGG